MGTAVGFATSLVTNPATGVAAGLGIGVVTAIAGRADQPGSGSQVDAHPGRVARP